MLLHWLTQLELSAKLKGALVDYINSHIAVILVRAHSVASLLCC